MDYLQQTFLLGHFRNPNFQDGLNVRWQDLKKLGRSAEVEPASNAARLVREAYISRSHSEAVAYRSQSLHLLGREPDYDGVFGEVMASTQRDCYVPDYPLNVDELTSIDDCDLDILESVHAFSLAAAQEAGTGNWRGCHSIGDGFHSCAIEINRANVGSRVGAILNDALKIVQRVIAGYGCLLTFVENGVDVLTGKNWTSNINNQMSFVLRSNGWIGLATVMKNVGCSTQQWCKFLSTYNPSDLLAKWVTLLMHEFGHNFGFGHQNGGVMNSYIVARPQHDISSSDPFHNLLTKAFGGVAIPDVGGDPPTPPDGDQWRRMIEDEIDRIKTVNSVQSSMISLLLGR